MNRSLLVAAALCAACSADPAPRTPLPLAPDPTPPVASKTAPASPEPDPRASEALPELPPPLAQPDAVACALETAKWPKLATLRLAANGPEYAMVEDGKARLSLPAGVAAAARLDFDGHGVTLAGYVATDDIVLHPNRAVVLGPVTLKASARLEWTGADATGVRLRYRPANVVVRVGSIATGETRNMEEFGIVALTAAEPTLACADVSLDPQQYDARPIATAGKPGWLKRGVVIAVAVEPTAAPSAKLKLDAMGALLGAADDDVEVLETRGKQTRILMERGDAFVLGWVATLSVRRRPQANSGGVAGMLGMLGGMPEPAPAPPASVVCAADLPLVAERDGVRATVGGVHAGQRLTPGAASGDLTRVDLVGAQWLTLIQGTTLSVRTAELARCGAAGAGDS